VGSEREKIYQRDFMITLKEAFEDLHDRVQKQIAEKIWEIERIKQFEDKSNEWYAFAGRGAVKKLVLKETKRELKERRDNLKVIKQILKNYASRRKPK
jgi:phosphopantetheinyl transferase (holo-ACP synthase)